MKKDYMIQCLLERKDKFKSLIGNGNLSKEYYAKVVPFKSYASEELTKRILMRKTKQQLKELDNQIAELIYKYEVLA